ncbi:hypothetical protein FRC04_011336 [Tulasnella sp. 424]|nr:hypothetical protein FRC04_011336 [Tulasnella sp. 424]KAG8975496.1 hypothetical protein FRC05_005565 [Tulasnella sp. 425]
MSTKNPTKHTAIALTAAKTLEAIEVPTRSPGDNEVLIKVDYASYGAGDAHAVDDNFDVFEYPEGVGLVATGKIVEVGKNVEGLKEGDEVGAFTQPGADRGLQQYVVAPVNRVSKIPSNIQPQDVAAVLDNFVTAWYIITNTFGLHLPKTLPDTERYTTREMSAPILIWGAGTGTSINTIQILRWAHYTNIIATASERTAPAAFEFGATHVFHYNDPDVIKNIKSVAGTEPIRYALDPVCTKDSLQKVSEVVKTLESKVAMLVPIKLGDLKTLTEGGAKLVTSVPEEMLPFDAGVEPVPTNALTWEQDPDLRDNLLTKILPQLLESKELKPQPVQVINKGSLLERVQEAAELVRTNQLRGTKAVVAFD